MQQLRIFSQSQILQLNAPTYSSARNYQQKNRAAQFAISASLNPSLTFSPLSSSSLHSATSFFSGELGFDFRAVVRSSGVGKRRRGKVVVAPRAEDADVPTFTGFPPMQTKPAWYWRIFACVPYILPLCEAWLYSETATALHPFLEVYAGLCEPVWDVLGMLPGWFMLAYFFTAFLGIVRNNRFPHFIRFHVVMGMLLEIILQVVGTVNDWIPPSVYFGKFGAHFWLAIAFAYILIVLECIWCAVNGCYADVPFISDAAYMQIPYE